MTESEWGMIAARMAKIAHEDHFCQRMGVFHLEDVDKVVIFNNNPYPKRDDNTETLRAALAADGFKELAYETHPADGDDEGYTYAMIVSAGQSHMKEVEELTQEIFAGTIMQRIVERMDDEGEEWKQT